MICIYLLYVLYICENILHHLLLYGVIPECPWIYKLFYWRCVSCFPFHLHLRQPSERRERPKNPASLTGLFNYYTDGWELIRIILRKLSCLVNSLIFFDFVQHFYLWITKWIKKCAVCYDFSSDDDFETDVKVKTVKKKQKPKARYISLCF